MNLDKEIFENSYKEITPIEKIGDMFFKREDKFSPLGYGGINGSKLRQAIYLIRGLKCEHLVSGASIKSPQLSMSTVVAKAYGIKTIHVIGATKPSTAIKAENVLIANLFGSEFKIVGSGFNSTLQPAAVNLAKKLKGFYLPYGITTPKESSVAEIAKFHLLGASQVDNFPNDIENLIIPTGSGNSCVSVLLGIGLLSPKKLKNIYLMGIGPDKLNFIFSRLKLLSSYLGENLLNFKGLNTEFFPNNGNYQIYYHNLNNGFTTYQDEIKFNYFGVDFHPTYEGKIMKFIELNLPELICDKSLFWIVGSKPYLSKMMDFVDNKIDDLSIWKEDI